MSKPSQLTAECASFTAWQMQMTAYLGIQRFRSRELTEAQLVQMVVMAIDVKLLRYLSVDGRTTVRSLCEAAEVQWRKARRPANPTASFYAVKCGNDLRSALHALEETGYYFGAVDQVVRQRLVEILPLTVRQLASVEIAWNPTISSSALVDLLEVVPLEIQLDMSCAAQPGTASVICHFCKAKGHIRRDCPKFVCFGCGKRGHFRNQCPQTSSSSSSVSKNV